MPGRRVRPGKLAAGASAHTDTLVGVIDQHILREDPAYCHQIDLLDWSAI